MPVYLEVGGKQCSMNWGSGHADHWRQATVGSAQNTSLGPSPAHVIPSHGSGSFEIGGGWRTLHGMTRRPTSILYAFLASWGVCVVSISESIQ